MKRVLPILLSMAGLMMLFAQNKPGTKLSIGGLPQGVSESIVNAQKNVLQKYDVLLKAKSKANPAAIKAAQGELKQAQTAAAEVVKPAASLLPSRMATAAQKSQMSQEAAQLYAQVEPLSESAANWQIGLILTSLGLGVASSVFSMFGRNSVSAGISALVVVASGIPNVYPIQQRAIYYQTLANQSHSLTSGLALPGPLSLADYDNDVRRWDVMESAIPFPGTSAGDPTEALLNQLDAAKIGAAEEQ